MALGEEAMKGGETDQGREVFAFREENREAELVVVKSVYSTIEVRGTNPDGITKARGTIPDTPSPRLATGKSGGLYTPPPPALPFLDRELQVPSAPPKLRQMEPEELKEYTPYAADWKDITEYRKERMEREVRKRARQRKREGGSPLFFYIIIRMPPYGLWRSSFKNTSEQEKEVVRIS
ncbi:hypothetical protein BDZ91DRAFT_791998 [Kalaharituber pfeilii]|nr:hypothetical protein BDZ91DRAFT_791998 [Kalaharituber pfeilii]